MARLVSAKCPNCKAKLKVSKADETVECEYCHDTIIVEEAIACFKIKVSGTVNVDGITTNSKLLDSANELLDMKEYLKAKKKFLEYVEKCPDNYQGWLGLLVCRTRNFTIKDDNIMFENDINKYYTHFLEVAPEDVKKQYVEIIEDYLHPERKIQNKVIENYSEVKDTLKTNSKVWWILGWILCWPIPATILVNRSKMSDVGKKVVIVLIWSFFILFLISSNAQ